MIKIGLTGGIGAGKSEVSTILSSLHVPIIDADSIANDLTCQDQTILAQIADKFGPAIIMEDNGGLDRKKLKDLIFSDAQKRKQLEAIIHPAVKSRIHKMVEAINTPYCIIVIPLLIEARMSDLVDKIAVVDCSLEKQLTRIMKRDGCSKTQALSIINAQAKRERRLASADYIIDNEHDIAHLQPQLLRLHQQWKEIQS